jgi:hypothetical protein
MRHRIIVPILFLALLATGATAREWPEGSSGGAAGPGGTLPAPTVDGALLGADLLGAAWAQVVSGTIFESSTRTALNLAWGTASDSAPREGSITGGAAWVGATGANREGGDLVLAAGIGRKAFTLIDRALTAGDTLTVTVNGTATAIVEGVDFVCAAAASDAACVANLTTEINAQALGVTASTSGLESLLARGAFVYMLDIDIDDVAGIDLVEGADGIVKVFGNPSVTPPSPVGRAMIRRNPSAGYWEEVPENRAVLEDGAGTEVELWVSGSLNAGTSVNGTVFTASTSVATALVNITGGGPLQFGGSTYANGNFYTRAAGQYYGTGLTGGMRWTSTDDGIPGTVVQQVLGTVLTAGTMTKGIAQAPPLTVAFTWTNAMVTALGATTTGDILVGTLPAKTVVVNAYMVIGTAETALTSLTGAVGRTGALFVDYIAASSLKAAASTVYGDAGAERGANLTGYDLPSYTGTTAVNLHLISGVENLNTAVACTGTVFVTYSILP